MFTVEISKWPAIVFTVWWHKLVWRLCVRSLCAMRVFECLLQSMPPKMIFKTHFYFILRNIIDFKFFFFIDELSAENRLLAGVKFNLFGISFNLFPLFN